MCASLPDLQRPPEPKSKPFESSPVVTAESKPLEASPETMTESEHVEPSIVNVAKPKNVVKEPIHVVRKRWFMQKRLKKVHLETLQKVYSRTKRPTVSELFLLVCSLHVRWCSCLSSDCLSYFHVMQPLSEWELSFCQNITEFRRLFGVGAKRKCWLGKFTFIFTPNLDILQHLRTNTDICVYHVNVILRRTCFCHLFPAFATYLNITAVEKSSNRFLQATKFKQ